MAVKKKDPASSLLGGLFAQPAPQFYTSAGLYAECGRAVELEGCRSVLFFDGTTLRADLGRWQVQLRGDGLVIEAWAAGQLRVRGRLLQAEFSISPGKGAQHG